MTEKIIEILLNWLTSSCRARRKSDIERYHRMCSELHYNSDPVVLLRDHDFTQSFHQEYLTPLNYIVEDWWQSEYEFHNYWVNRRKRKFLLSLKEFIDELSLYTGMENNGMMSIGVRDVERKERKDREKVAKNINELALNSLKKYETFINVGKNRFHQ